jgi:hypothetical protein
MILAIADKDTFAHADTIDNNKLWGLIEEALINPMYRDPISSDVFSDLFAVMYPTEVAIRMYTTVLCMLEAEPFFRSLGPFRYTSPSQVYIVNGNYQVVWAE